VRHDGGDPVALRGVDGAKEIGMTASETKAVRFPLRMSQTQRTLLEEAAALSGQNLTEFILSAAQERAERLSERQATIRLTEQDTLALVQALREPRPVTPTLHALLDELDQRVESRP
jgi:uncharacterized protein (DUF1778 family)